MWVRKALFKEIVVEFFPELKQTLNLRKCNKFHA